ncbi:MAG: hypothetical protein ABSG28_01530 [Methanoregula sp.]|jgi:hypothetical protein|uniref:hypothetical protein n=1 Tax=Methanoregula sp. TaxID=2052170 RepID=UPI003C1F2A43
MSFFNQLALGGRVNPLPALFLEDKHHHKRDQQGAPKDHNTSGTMEYYEQAISIF